MLSSVEILSLLSDLMQEKGFVPYHVSVAKQYANVMDGCVNEKEVRKHLQQALEGTAPEGSSADILRGIFRDRK